MNRNTLIYLGIHEHTLAHVSTQYTCHQKRTTPAELKATGTNAACLYSTMEVTHFLNIFLSLHSKLLLLVCHSQFSRVLRQTGFKYKSYMSPIRQKYRSCISLQS